MVEKVEKDIDLQKSIYVVIAKKYCGISFRETLHHCEQRSNVAGFIILCIVLNPKRKKLYHTDNIFASKS